MYYKYPRDHVIPKVCHQTWYTREISPEFQKVMKNNKLKNPDIEFKLYTDNDMDMYIKKNFDDLTYTAFKKINPKYGAALADFFRYCVLYNEGGIYLDIKSSLTTKLFGNIIKNDDICILDKQRSHGVWRYKLGYGTYEQWLLIFCKGHLYLKNMINLMVEALHSDIEPKPFNMTWFGFGPTSTKEKVLRLTGPDAFAVAIHKSIIFNGIMHREINYNSFSAYDYMNINKKVHRRYNKIHYSQLTEPIII
jgi:mannosyltransferase OCH1-like enzyme